MQAFLVSLLTVFIVSASADQYIRVKRDIADLSNIVVRQKREDMKTVSHTSESAKIMSFTTKHCLVDRGTKLTVGLCIYVTGGVDRILNLSITDPRACTKKCEKDLDESIRNNTVYEGASSPFSILKDNFDKAGIEAVCKEFKKSKSCFTKCNEPSHALGVYLIICEQKKQELINHLPCYHKVKNDTEKACEDKCGGQAVAGAIAASGNSQSSNQSPTDIKNLLNSMRPMCNFLNCAVNCASETFTQKCPKDPKAGEFFREIGMAGAQTALGDLEALDAALGTKLLPTECLAIISPNAVHVEDVQNLSSASDKSVGCDKLAEEVHETQMAVLEKTNKMLDMEIAKLELETKLIEKQLRLLKP